MHGFLDVVRDEQDRVALFFQDAQQLHAHLEVHEGVERRERLVHVEDLGLHHERPRDLHAFQHAPGQFVRIAFLETFQSHHRRVVVGEFRLFRLADAVQAEHQVLLHRQPREYGAVLGNEDALRARAVAHLAVDDDTAFVRLIEAAQHLHQRGFAAAGGADDGDEFAVADREADAADDRQRALARLEASTDVVDDDLVRDLVVHLSVHSATLPI